MEEWKLQRIAEALYPKSIAVLGVSEAANNLGTQVVDGLLLEGFAGEIYPVHPRLKTLLGLKVYPNLEEIGRPVDLVISSLNAKLTTETVIESCARIGAKGIVCFAGGFKEVGAEGLLLERKLKEVADANRIIIFGPNILGVINNESRLYATFWSFKKGNPAGRVSIISQSGGTASTMLNEMIDNHVGVNKWVCLGNRTNLEFSDMFGYFAADSDTGVVAALVEGIEDGRGFMEAAQNLARRKPLVLLKGARSQTTSAAASSHTGTMGGTYRIFKDACRQYGILEAGNSNELAVACKALAIAPIPRGPRVAVLTHTAGPSILALDTLVERGCPLAQASPQTLARIKGILGEHIPVVLAPNPIDLTGSGLFVEPFSKSVQALLEDDAVDIVIAIYAVHRNFAAPSKALAELKRKTAKPVIVCVLASRDEVRADVEIMQEAGIPVYLTPEDAALAASYLAKYHQYAAKGGAHECN